MPSFDSRAVAAILVGLLAILAVAVVAEAYVQRSYELAFEEFIAANTSSVSESDKLDTKSKSGCPVGKKELPTQLMPFR